MGFSRQEHWSGLLFPSPGDLPDPGMKPVSLTSLALAGGFFTTSATWEAPLPLPFPLCKSILFPLLAGQGLSLGPPWLQTPNCNSLLILNVFAGEITACFLFCFVLFFKVNTIFSFDEISLSLSLIFILFLILYTSSLSFSLCLYFCLCLDSF